MTKTLFKKLQEIATLATVIPLSIFTNFFHQRYPKHRYLESTLELFQQFYLCVEEATDDKHNMFPGEKYLTSLKCIRCNARVTSGNSGIVDTLLQAPTAILRHLHILQLHAEENDGDMAPFESLPLMFTTSDNYLQSKKSFQEEVGFDRRSLLHSVFCTTIRDEEFKFCEAVKVDVSNTSNKKKHQEAVIHSMSLVKVLFEDFGLSRSCRIPDDSQSDNYALDLNASLFNKSKELSDGYEFEKYSGRDSSMNEDEVLFFDIKESWCLFLHRSVHKSKLALLNSVANIIYRDGTGVTKKLLSLLGYDDFSCEVMLNYFQWRKSQRSIQSLVGKQLIFTIKCDGKDYDVISAPYRPWQYNMGEISNIASIYDKKGKGWEKINRRRFFLTGDSREDNAIPSNMTSSHQFEENLILLETLAEIKRTDTGKKTHKFRMRCFFKNYERGNNAIRLRHKQFFRDVVNHHYEFSPSNELIETLDYDFVKSLKSGTWNKLPRDWLLHIKKKIQTAMESSIKSIKLVRILGIPNVLPGNDRVMKPPMERRFIYEIYMERSNFYVYYAQISDIIGEEPWIRSEVNCLCNVASERKVLLTLGAKKKETPTETITLPTSSSESVKKINGPTFWNVKSTHISRGDRVLVTNLGNLFPTAVVKKINYEKNTAQIKWDTSRTLTNVSICDLRLHFDDDNSKRKRKQTDFLHNQHNVKKKKPSSVNSDVICVEDDDGSIVTHKMPFYSSENASKLCAEGALKNLLHMLKMEKRDIDLFWGLATSPLAVISDTLKSNIPKAVCNQVQTVNAIEKCLWILRKRFKFTSTKRLKVTSLTTVQATLLFLEQCRFPVIISVTSRGALYEHVVVVWNGDLLDYESEYICKLSEDSLQQICGNNTSFRGVTDGYGIFPSKDVKNNCPDILDWGTTSYFDKNSKLRRYFVRN